MHRHDILSVPGYLLFTLPAFFPSQDCTMNHTMPKDLMCNGQRLCRVPIETQIYAYSCGSFYPDYLQIHYSCISGEMRRGEEKELLFSFFLVACTRLYKPLCRSVRRSVGPSVRHTLLFSAKWLIETRVRDLCGHCIRQQKSDRTYIEAKYYSKEGKKKFD